jgi:hypothetical protein
VECRSNNDFTKIRVHSVSWGGGPQYNQCFANAGEFNDLDPTGGGNLRLHSLWTGNNNVEWLGDGSWSISIPKWSARSYNDPAGVRIDGIRIL